MDRMDVCVMRDGCMMGYTAQQIKNRIHPIMPYVLMAIVDTCC